jgi:short subunit dehydrogenase-like uncharacterized protein
VREQDFGRGPVPVVTVGWGDVSTAYYSTGIPNIETYFSFPAAYIRFLKAMRFIGPLLYNRAVKSLLKSAVNVFLPSGPSEERRTKGFAIFIGEVTDENGGRAVSKLVSPEGYTCTALTTVEIMKRILNGETRPGFQTPSLAYGADFILPFDGVKREDLV